MLVILYRADKHKKYALKCLKSRKMDSTLADDLPENGYIAFNEDKVVGMGFMRMVEGSYAIMDSYITNAKMPSDVRDEALDEITSGIIALARGHGIKKLLTFSLEENILSRAKRHNFKNIPYIFSMLELDSKGFSSTVSQLQEK